MNKIDVIWDMETGDPDDVFTLCLLTTHSSVNLRAVTVTPGTRDQIGLVKHILNKVNMNIPVGSFNINHEKDCVSGWYKSWQKFDPSMPDGEGCDVIYDALKKYPDTILLTGAPLKNLGAALRKYTDLHINMWVGQGGFAGDNVVPKEYRLEKFNGMVTCPTYNFNGDPNSAELALNSDQIDSVRLVSKNVCHGVIYNKDMHERLRPLHKAHPGLELMFNGIDFYLKKHSGKKWHDPLAFYAMLCPHEFEWRNVKLYRERGKWGSVCDDESKIKISIKAPDDFIYMFGA